MEGGQDGREGEEVEDEEERWQWRGGRGDEVEVMGRGGEEGGGVEEVRRKGWRE